MKAARLNKKEFKDLRKNLRKNQTEQERILWSKLRKKQLLEYKFYRQFGIDNYIVDFFCPKLRLVIEVDGSQHSLSEKDQIRDEYLNKLGFRVLRFWNIEISKSIDSVLETIVREIELNQTPPSPS